MEHLSTDVNMECAQLRIPLSVALEHAPDAVVDAMMDQVDPNKGQLMHHALWRALGQPEWNTRFMDALMDRRAPINNKMYDCAEATETTHQMSAIPFGTPLHIAVRAQHAVAIRYLLQHGANPSVPDEAGKTPLDMVTEDIRALLVQ